MTAASSVGSSTTATAALTKCRPVWATTLERRRNGLLRDELEGLGTLLEQDYLREAVQACLKEDAIAKRLKVAARWFSEAHYTMAQDDAALALGVAMDALLRARLRTNRRFWQPFRSVTCVSPGPGRRFIRLRALTGQRSMPGSAMADRLALLAEDPMMRPKLVQDYLAFYGVRSSVAHGGQSSRLDNENFMDKYRASVRWAAWRFLALRDRFGISTEEEIDALYDDLRWGVRSWETPVPPEASVEPNY